MNYTGDIQSAEPEASSPQASEFMTKKVVTITSELLVIDAIALFLKKGLAGAPVVDEHQKLLGIFTEKDCLKIMAHSSYYHEESHHRVADYMARNILTVGPETELTRIVDLFLNNPFRLIPVVKDNRVVGMLSRTSCLEAFKKRKKR